VNWEQTKGQWNHELVPLACGDGDALSDPKAVQVNHKVPLPASGYKSEGSRRPVLASDAQFCLALCCPATGGQWQGAGLALLQRGQF